MIAQKDRKYPARKHRMHKKTREALKRDIQLGELKPREIAKKYKVNAHVVWQTKAKMKSLAKDMNLMEKEEVEKMIFGKKKEPEQINTKTIEAVGNQYVNLQAPIPPPPQKVEAVDLTKKQEPQEQPNPFITEFNQTYLGTFHPDAMIRESEITKSCLQMDILWGIYCELRKIRYLSEK